MGRKVGVRGAAKMRAPGQVAGVCVANATKRGRQNGQGEENGMNE